MNAPAPVAPAPAAAWPLFRTLVGAGAVCGLLIAVVYEWSRPIVERNRQEALRAAVFRVLPGARTARAFAWRPEGGFRPLDGPPPAGAAVVQAGYREDGRFVGVAVEAAGMGYQDTIRLLWGYEPAGQTVTGMVVLESRETPGLGDKIETDPDFQANFSALDVSLDAAGAALANPIVAVARGRKQAPWQIDGITGATVSSAAIAGILDRSARTWAPRVRAALANFEGGR